MLELNLEKFWEADEIAHEENCFTKKATQVAMGIRMSDECVFAELNEEGKPWGETERETRISLNKRYNDLAEKIVGKRLLREEFVPIDAQFPHIPQIGEIFGGVYEFHQDSLWLHSDIETPEQIEKQLDKIDRMDLEDFLIPKNWVQEKKRIFEKYGINSPLQRNVRGPVTLATSIIGVENFIYLLYDEPEIAKRFSETIKKVLFAYIDIFDREAGFTEKNRPAGFNFFDDDSNLLTPEMYEAFGYPVLKAVFEKVSPNKNDRRYQHSDSAMGHLMPLLSKLDLNGVNFGPTISVTEIRKHLPNARIDGQLAPFTFMRNNQDDIIAEVKRDCEMAKIDDLRGVNITTAGSINNGSSLMSMRAVMWAINKYGQY
ncbi:MAG: uroporphyrinogen decarboxylase family protein [Clostridia bacterium]